MPPKIKLCEKCRQQFKKASARGGRNGSKLSKLRASSLAAVARAEKALKLTHDGKSFCVSRWSKLTGIPASTIWARLRRGLSTNQILKPPTKTKP